VAEIVGNEDLVVRAEEAVWARYALIASSDQEAGRQGTVERDRTERRARRTLFEGLA
jgi:hypothetical protein